MEGYLYKWSGKKLVSNYKRRWFSLHGTELVYSENATPGAKVHGTIELKYVQRISRGDPGKHRRGVVAVFASNVFEIALSSRTFVLFPEREEELRQWISALATVVPPTTFQGDLRTIADHAAHAAAGPSWAEPIPSDSAARSRLHSAGSDGSNDDGSLVAAKAKHMDDSASLIAVGDGKYGGSGFFSRAPKPASLPPSTAADRTDSADPSRIVNLEESFLEMQSRMSTMQRELDTMRSGKKSFSAGAAGGGGSFAEPLLSKPRSKSGLRQDWDSREEADSDEERGEPEFLPGCAFCGGRCTCKVFFLVMVNIVVIATGIAVATVGGYAAANSNEFGAILTPLATYILIGVGCLFAITGVLGSFAATRFFRKSGKCLLFIYMVIMLVLTLSEAVGVTLLIVDVMGVQAPVEGAQVNQQITQFFDTLYTTCCNATQAERSSQTCSWIPPQVTEGCPNEAKHAFEVQVTDLIKSDLAPIGGGAGAVVFIHAVAAWFALTLACPCCSCSRLFCCCCKKKAEEDDSGGRSRSKSRSRSGSMAPSRKGSMKPRRKSTAGGDDMDDFFD